MLSNNRLAESLPGGLKSVMMTTSVNVKKYFLLYQLFWLKQARLLEAVKCWAILIIAINSLGSPTLEWGTIKCYIMAGSSRTHK